MLFTRGNSTSWCAKYKLSRLSDGPPGNGGPIEHARGEPHDCDTKNAGLQRSLGQATHPPQTHSRDKVPSSTPHAQTAQSGCNSMIGKCQVFPLRASIPNTVQTTLTMSILSVQSKTEIKAADTFISDRAFSIKKLNLPDPVPSSTM